ncbi:MAG: fimbrial protein [Dyella sp.]|uniref:fimbrial protein n=1 Tax=Dyella sp. TaxID=1869338 RepID=UPI003F7D3CBE
MTFPRLCLLLAMLVMAPRVAHAGSGWCLLNGQKETVSMTLPSTVTLNPNANVGDVLAASMITSPSPANSVAQCYYGSPIGVINLVDAQPVGSSPIFSTGVAGVGYRILHPDSGYILPPWGYDSIDSGSYTLSVGSVLQLVKTGPIVSGVTLGAGTLGYWRYGGIYNDLRAEDFVLANSVTFVAPSCTVTTPSISVTLPTVSVSALAGAGATAGTTPFAIGLNCPSAATGRQLAIQFDTNQSYAGANGVIVPGAGSSKNIGVQLLDSSFSPSIVFGTPSTVGNTPTGQFNLTYYARYYAMPGTLKAGTLGATATFTISYP